MVKKLLVLVAIIILSREPVEAVCGDRYATIVNPVRSRELWKDKSIEPIDDQYKIIKEQGMAASWLIQNDVLKDKELVGYLKNFDEKQEIGLLMEVSKNLADKARVIYPVNIPWYKPNVIFLSGYSQRERKKLIDTMFNDFKKEMGYWPKSVGAWWIDSYSVEYIKNKYDITTVMIVADQKTTDDYGVWGQWWGVPYYPSKTNILRPAQTVNNKSGVVVIQWAQRDISKAIGDGPKYSNYSLQANDYIRQGLDTNYFKKLAGEYLDCSNQVGQITVGLETGIESVDYIKEYENQIKAIGKMTEVKTVTMSQFGKVVSDKFPKMWPDKVVIRDESSEWQMSSLDRTNDKLGLKTEYNNNFVFGDYFVADKSEFLDRKLPDKVENKTNFYLPVWILLLTGGVIWLIKKRSLATGIGFLLFSVAWSGLILKSGYQYGWWIYYGYQTPLLIISQCLLVAVSFLIINVLRKYAIYLWLSFAVDAVLLFLRASIIEGKYWVGIVVDTFRFIGVGPINKDLEGWVAGSLLKFDFEKIWINGWLSLLVYPMVHIILGVLLYWLINKLPKKLKYVLMALLMGLSMIWMMSVVTAEIRLVAR